MAAMTSDQSLRTDLISGVHNRASYNRSAGVFPTEYDSTFGSTIQGGARCVPRNLHFAGYGLIFTTAPCSPAQGAMYAPLALK